MTQIIAGSPLKVLSSLMSQPDSNGMSLARPSDMHPRTPMRVDGGENPRFFTAREENEVDQPRSSVSAPPSRSGPASAGQVTMSTTGQPATKPAEEDQPAPLDSAGHLVSIAMVFATTEKPASAREKPSVKKKRTIKSDHVVMDGISRVDFIKAFLRVHDLANQYSPGVHSGPQFQLWWSGSSGGKAGASTIDNDHDFEVARTALLKKKKDASVGVEFDIDSMDGYRIRKRPILHVDQDPNEEPAYATKVPRVDSFSEDAQIHGNIILQLKTKWACAKHLGEHGDVGYCYISPTGEHIGLNHRKLKLWAAAIAAADATKHAPPNSVEFDCIRDGRLDVIKPRGRVGPRSPSAGSMSDPTTVLLTAVALLVASQVASKTPSSATGSTTLPDSPSTPTRHSRQYISPPLSPIPTAGTEIHSCLRDLLVQKGIDFCAAADVLSELDCTPDIIAAVPLSRLCDVLGVVEGRALKLQIFAREWNGRLQLKKKTHLDLL